MMEVGWTIDKPRRVILILIMGWMVKPLFHRHCPTPGATVVQTSKIPKELDCIHYICSELKNCGLKLRSCESSRRCSHKKSPFLPSSRQLQEHRRRLLSAGQMRAHYQPFTDPRNKLVKSPKKTFQAWGHPHWRRRMLRSRPAKAILLR